MPENAPPGSHGRVAGKVALITGAAQGMGAAHARALAREGANVAIADIAADAGEALAEELRAGGSAASHHGHDVTDSGAWRELIAAVERIHGPIGVLVNNAGIQVRSVGVEAGDEEWDKVVAVNAYTGSFASDEASWPLGRVPLIGRVTSWSPRTLKNSSGRWASYTSA